MIGLNRLRMGELNKYHLHYCEIEGERQMPLGESNLQPCAPKRDLMLHLRQPTLLVSLFQLPAPWCSGRDVGLLMDLEVVAFFVAWLALDQQPELYPSERQHPTVWVAACSYRARL